MIRPPPRSQSGTAIIEFAIAFPIFLLVFFGVVEFARLMVAFELGAEVTRRAARIASTCNMGTAQRDAIVARLQPMISASGLLQQTSASWLTLSYEPVGCAAETCRFVEARLTGLQPELAVPGMSVVIALPEFPARMPREAMTNAPDGKVNGTC